MKKNIISKVNRGLRLFGTFILAGIPICLIVILSMFLFKNVWHANAQVSAFYPTSCLGGWSNTENVTGKPNVTDRNGEHYSEVNSATLLNLNTQIFCGGFNGEVPKDALQKKVVLKFSWTLEGNNTSNEATTTSSSDTFIMNANDIAPDASSTSAHDTSATKDTSDMSASVLNAVPESTPSTAATSTSDSVITPEPAPKSAPVPETEAVPAPEPAPSPAPTPAPEPTPQPSASVTPEASVTVSQAILNALIPHAYAQAANPVSVDEKISSVTGDTAIPQDAIFQVLYTLDGNNWKSIGYVTKISNDVSFDMPMDIFTDVTDLQMAQIAVRSVPTSEIIPKVYLDSLWLEVEYQNASDIKEVVTKGVSGFKVFVLSQDNLESGLNDWFSTQEGIIVDDVKIESYGGGGYLAVVNYQKGGTGKSTTKFKLITGEHPEEESQAFLSSLRADQTVLSVSATTGAYSGPEQTITVPIIFIVYE